MNIEPGALRGLSKATPLTSSLTLSKSRKGDFGAPNCARRPSPGIESEKPSRYKTRLNQGNHFATVPSASSGGSVTRRKPRSQCTRTHS